MARLLDRTRTEVPANVHGIPSAMLRQTLQSNTGKRDQGPETTLVAEDIFRPEVGNILKLLANKQTRSINGSFFSRICCIDAKFGDQ